MSIPLFTNNASTTLALGVGISDTTINLYAGSGALFPSPAGSNYFYISLISSSTSSTEIMKCTNRTGDVLTVVRGQDGTSAQYWNVGDRVELRVTAASLNLFANGAGTNTGTAATQVQEFTATQGQTVFTLSFNYIQNVNNLAVFVNGSKQISSTNYSESTTSSITFLSGLNAGDLVEVIYNLPVAAGQIDASNISYTQGGTGSVTTNVQAKLQQTVSVKDFGAVGDGSTDDTAAIQAAITASANKALYFPSGDYYFIGTLTISNPMYIYGDGYSTRLHPYNVSGNTIRVNASNVTFSNIRLDGTTPGGIAIGYSGAVTNFLIENCYFKTVAQCVWLWTVDNVMVQNCTFDSTGYGVIQQAGYSSNYVTVDNNIAFNMLGDLVEANSSTVASGWWTITNNVFEGSNGYPTGATERRFVGITNVKNVIISNNNVQKCAGDAAIHLEDLQGECIINANIFDNCICSGGNNGYIYVLNTAKDVTVTNNIFLRSDSSLSAAYAYSSSSNVYNNSLIFSGNRILGASGSSNFGGLALQGGSGIQTINGNTFQNVTDCINTGTNNLSNVSIKGNIAITATNFYYCPGVIGTVGGGGSNVLIEGNFTKSVTGYDVTFGQNTNGTTPSSNISILSNVFSKSSLIRDLTSSNTNIVYANNVLSSTASITLAATTQQYSNYVSSGSVFNNVSVLSNYANDSAASSGGVPIGGMYRNGSVVQIRVT